MQGSFEKIVQEKLEDMSLQPSVPVWEKIELQIRPEERRRRILFWLLPVILLLGVAGWWFFIDNNENETGTGLQTTPVAKKSAPKQQPVATKDSGSKTTTLQTPPTQERLAITYNNNKKNFQQQSVSMLVSHKNEIQRVIEKEEDNKAVSLSEGGKVPPMVTQEHAAEAAPTARDKAEAFVINEAKSVDSAAQLKAGEKKQENVLTAADSLKKKVAAVKKKSAHKILFAAGWSQVTSAASAGNLYASPSQSTTPGSYTGGATQTRPIESGFAFSIGYAREKRLSGKLSLSFGLQYAYYSTRQQIGSFKIRDTALRFQDKAFEVSGYYSAPPAGSVATMTEYTTRIHVAELPLSVQYSPFKSLPLSFAGGVSYGRVLQSNALTYDAAARVYYLNQHNNRRNYVDLFSTAQYRFLRNAKLAISAGPAVQYNLVPLQKESSKRHLFFAGLKTEIIF